MEKQKLIFTFLIINLLVLNLAFVYLYFKPPPAPSPSSSTPDQSELQAKIDQLKNDLISLQTQMSVTSTPLSAPPLRGYSTGASPTGAPQTSYIPVPGSGSLLAYQWTKLAGTEFYFNPADFPNLSKAYFEANIKLLNGNGLAFLRLFDLTAGIEIWGSEIQTASQTDTIVVSSPLTFRSGNHLLCVQAKSLTADTTVFTSGRLKIISR